jgi:hypothetical protein
MTSLRGNGAVPIPLHISLVRSKFHQKMSTKLYRADPIARPGGEAIPPAVPSKCFRRNICALLFRLFGGKSATLCIKLLISHDIAARQWRGSYPSPYFAREIKISPKNVYEAAHTLIGLIDVPRPRPH